MAARRVPQGYVLGVWRLVSRGGTWYRHGYEPGSYHVARVSLKTKSFEEAKAKLKEWFYEHEKAAPLHGGPLLLHECLDRYWLRHAKHIASGRVIKTQIRYWKAFFGDVPVIGGVTYARVDAFTKHLQGRGLSASTVNHTLMCGRAAMRMAWKRDELPSVPNIQAVKVGDQEPKGRPLSIEEMRRAYQTSDGHLRTLIIFLIGTASRPVAIYDLDWKQVDRENGLIYLNAPGRVQSKKYRPTVRLPDLIAAMPHTEGPVISWEGEKIGTAVAAWRKARKRAGLDGRVNLYSFRTSVARYLRKNGVSVEDIELQLGHRKAGETGRYMGYDPAYLQNAVRVINELLELVVKEPVVCRMVKPSESERIGEQRSPAE